MVQLKNIIGFAERPERHIFNIGTQMRFTAFDYSQLSACFAPLSKPARRALINNKIFHLEDLVRLSQDEVRKLHGIGPFTVLKLDEMLASKGLALRSPPLKRKSRVEIFRD